MKESAAPSATAFIDQRIQQLGDWRGQTFAKLRGLVHAANPEIVEELKWVKPSTRGTPVFSHAGIVCTGETYKNVVKLTFAKGASLSDPSRLFNSSLEGNVRRAIDFHEGDTINEPAFKALISAAVDLNLRGKSKSAKPKAAKSARAPRGKSKAALPAKSASTPQRKAASGAQRKSAPAPRRTGGKRSA